MSETEGEPGGLTQIKLPDEIVATIDTLPKETRGPIRELVVKVAQSHFRGPFPPPDMLDDYERHQPGFLAALMQRAGEAQTHAQDMERLSIEGPLIYAKRGQIFGFLIVVVGAIGATVCATYGATGIGITLGLGAAAPIIGHFVKNPLSNTPAPPDPKTKQSNGRTGQQPVTKPKTPPRRKR
ncbi:hypothetical protein [Kaistia sp. MMO-174]|uniref:hypothetical protein n=1 Tax=Kaistia sp. MMO-174 TaxID=3081256 RepID=UPI00301A9E1D